MKKNILFYYDAPFVPERGGIERVTDRIAHALLAEGYQVYYLYSTLESYRFIDYQPTIKSFFLPEPRLLSSPNIDYYRQLIRRLNIDVVINQHAQIKAVRLLSQTGNPQVSVYDFIHSNPLFDYNVLFLQLSELKDPSLKGQWKRFRKVLKFPRKKMGKWLKIKRLYQSIYQQGHTLCLLSETYKPIVARFSKMAAQQALTLPNPNTFESIACPPAKTKTVLYMGRLDQFQKRITFLIDIWKSVSPRHEDWRLVIAGEGADEDFLRTYAQGANHLTFVGKVMPEAYYKEAAILCMTSLFEGFPMSLTEGMQWGCVPIAFDSFEAVHDIIRDKENGRIIPAFDKEAFANALHELMSDDTLRENYAQAAQKHIARYDIRHILPLWINLIENSPQNKPL